MTTDPTLQKLTSLPPKQRTLPDGLVKTGASPDFDADSLPGALRSHHHIADGNFGRLVVLAGSLDWIYETSAGERSEHLVQGETLVILPEEVHRVVLGEQARLRIEFFRRSAAGSA